jgi:hypothetical protein
MAILNFRVKAVAFGRAAGQFLLARGDVSEPQFVIRLRARSEMQGDGVG